VNEIVVPRFPSTLGPATGDAHETLGLSTVRTLPGSPWLARASPVTLSPVNTTTATTSRRAPFRFPRRTCLAINPYLLLWRRPAGPRATYRTNKTAAHSALGGRKAERRRPDPRDPAVAAADRAVWSCRAFRGAATSRGLTWGTDRRPLLLGGGGPPQGTAGSTGRQDNQA